MARKKPRKGAEGIPAELEDEVDVFHKGKEKIRLTEGQDEDDDQDLSEDEIDVYNLQDSNEEDDEEEDEQEDEDDSDGEGEGRLAARKSINWRPSLRGRLAYFTNIQAKVWESGHGYTTIYTSGRQAFEV